ncbi:hypothetical protein Taro_007449 [Colocasia esculenta]|uniref:Uncharacterized protein n=1 Tax=Colocasia esculenta TaxID=4460 RepID=A0A843TY57_COLES|nr:hypothetical protein [Colocasia esculenta]
MATLVEVAIWSRRSSRSRSGRDGLAGGDEIVTLVEVVEIATLFGETSQQRQGARRAEETGW